MVFGHKVVKKKKRKEKTQETRGGGEHMVERGVRGACCLNKKTRQYEDRHGHEIWHGR